MGAWHHLNTDQTGYWVDPVEHLANLKHSNDAEWRARQGRGGMNTMWVDKEWEGRQPASSGIHGSGLYDDVIKSREIRKPMPLQWDPDAQPGDPTFRTSPRQIDAHHRAAIAAAVQKETGQQIRLPVEFVPPPALKPAPVASSSLRITHSPDSGSSGIAGLVAAIDAAKGKMRLEQ